MQLDVTYNVHTSKNDQIRVVLRVIHSDNKNEQLLSLTW